MYCKVWNGGEYVESVIQVTKAYLGMFQSFTGDNNIIKYIWILLFVTSEQHVLGFNLY